MKRIIPLSPRRWLALEIFRRMKRERIEEHPLRQLFWECPGLAAGLAFFYPDQRCRPCTDLSTDDDAGTDDRWIKTGVREYTEYAEHAVKRGGRYYSGRLYGFIRLV